MASDDPSSGPGDWIEELFPPAFSYTVEELLKKFQEDEKDANLNVFQKSVKYRISEVDIEKLKNVYEKVWLMTKLEKEEKAKREGRYLGLHYKYQSFICVQSDQYYSC